MWLSFKNFGSIIFENQLLGVSIVNFNSADNNSAREGAFSCTKSPVAASLS